MQDRGADKLSGIKRAAKWGVVGVGVIFAVVAANAGCNARVSSAETSSRGGLQGYGYDIDSSALGPNIIRISARATYLPMMNSYNNLKRAVTRTEEACGEFEQIESASDKITAKKDAMVIYGTVPNRLACLGQ